MSKKVLVTGGAGYIGCVLVPELLAKGWSVRVFDNFLFGDEGLAPVHDRLELVKGDVAAPPADLMDGVDAVIHLGGISSQAKASFRSPRYTDLMNHISTELLANLAKRNGVERFILASSCSIYATHKFAPGPAEAPIYDEKSAVEIPNPYGLSKRAAEEALLEMADASFRPVMLRQGTVYGFSPKMRYDLVLNAFTKDAFTKRKIVINAEGELWRPMVDIRDVVAAYLAALELPAERLGDGIFNVLFENYRLKDLALNFQAALRRDAGAEIEVEFRPYQPALSYRADNAKFLETFGLRPTRAPHQAVMEIWRALEKGHDHSDLRFYNDPWYEHLAKTGRLEAVRAERTPAA